MNTVRDVEKSRMRKIFIMYGNGSMIKMVLKLIKICLVVSILIPIGFAFQAPLNVSEVSELTAPFAIETQWDHTFGGPYEERIASVIQTNDGGYVMFGRQGIDSDQLKGNWVIKIDSNGQVEWNNTYDREEQWESPKSITQTPDNGYIFVTIIQFHIGDDISNIDIRVVKISESGQIVFDKLIGDPFDWELCHTIIPTSGGYIISGGTWNGVDERDFFLMKIDENGDQLWYQTYGGWMGERADSVVQTSDDGYLLTGRRDLDDLDWTSDLWVVKTDSDGNLQMNYTLGGDKFDGDSQIIKTSDGGFAIGATTKSYGTGLEDYWLIKLDGNGVPLWNKTYGSSHGETFGSLIQTSDGGFALLGTIDSIDQSLGAINDDIWLLKTDSIGDVAWNGRMVMNQDQDWGIWLSEAEDGYFVIAGATKSKGAGEEDLWLMKTAGKARVLKDDKNDDEGLSWNTDNLGIVAFGLLFTVGLGGLIYITSGGSPVEKTAMRSFRTINSATKNTVKRIFNGDTSKYLLVAGNVFRDKKYGSATDVPPELFECKPLLHPLRMAMMKVLIDNPLMTSVELKEYLDLSWSEFRTQMTVLKKLKYVHVTDKFIENNVKQVISVEAYGITEFNKLSKALFEFLGSSKYELYLNSIESGKL